MHKNVTIRALLICAVLHCSLSAGAEAINNRDLVTADDPLAKSVVAIEFEDASEKFTCTGT